MIENVTKILLSTRPIYPPWDEGSKNFAYLLAKHNIKQKNQFSVLTCEKTKKESLALPKNVLLERIYSDGKWVFWQKIRWIWFHFRCAHKFDILHFLFTPTRFNTWLIGKFFLRKKSRQRVIQTIAAINWKESKKELKKKLFDDVLVTYTKYSQKYLQNLGCQNVFQIYPGIDLDEFNFLNQKDAEFLAKFGLNQNDIVLTYPGEFIRLGGVDHIVDAVINFFAQNPESRVRLLLALREKKEHGDLAKKKEIESKIRRLNLESKIIFTGFVIDMKKLYNISDAIIFPVKNMDGKFDVPLVIIEALACGRPVLFSDLPIFEEFCVDESVLKINLKEKDALVNFFAAVSNGKIQLEKLQKSARTFAEKNFSIQTAVEKYEKIYDGF